MNGERAETAFRVVIVALIGFGLWWLCTDYAHRSRRCEARGGVMVRIGCVDPAVFKELP